MSLVPGCHSHYLWEDIGLPLNPEAIDNFVPEIRLQPHLYRLHGRRRGSEGVNLLAQYVHEEYPQFRVAWGDGRTVISPSSLKTISTIKIGPYIKH